MVRSFGLDSLQVHEAKRVRRDGGDSQSPEKERRVKAIWEWLKAHWKPIVKALLAGLAMFAAVKVAEAVIKAVVGTVSAPQAWKPLDETHVSVRVGDEWRTVELPKDSAGRQVKTADIKAIAVVPGRPAVVEVTRAQIDRG